MTQKFKKTTLTLAMATSFMLGAIPIFTLAEETKVNDPISEYKAIKKEAESLGIEVTEQFEAESDIFEDELDKINKANEAVNASYKAAKDAISKKIESYKSEVDKNKQSFETAIKTFAGNDAQGNQKDVWDTSKWAEFLLGEEGKGLNKDIVEAQGDAKTNLQNKRLSLLMSKISNMAFVTPATNETKLISIKRKNDQEQNKYDNINTPVDKLKTGDIIRYGKVFKSNKAKTDTNKDGWVDLQLTIEKIIKFTNNNNVVNSEEVNEVQLKGFKLSSDNPQLYYEENVDLQIKVAFVKNGTDDLISLATIVTFTDVDEYQAVSIDTGVEAVLCGSKVSLANNTVRSASTSNTSTSTKYKGTADSAEPNYRSNWLVYRLSDTSEFTYTYYHGTTDTIHGIGDANVTGAISGLNKIKLDNKIIVKLSKYNIKKRPEPEEIPYVESSKETYVPIIEVPKMKVAKTGEAAQVLNHLSLVFFITAGLYLAKQK